MKKQLIPFVFILCSALLSGKAFSAEPETDLVSMVRRLPLSPYNSAGKYEQSLAECERKLAELPADTQSLYVAYCYKNMVYSLRCMNRNEELADTFSRLLRDFPVNLPLLSVISMDDLPSSGYWQNHFFHRAESGFEGKQMLSLQRHDRIMILRAMLDPAVNDPLKKTSCVTRALYYRNLVKHLTKVPVMESLYTLTDLAVLPGIELSGSLQNVDRTTPSDLDRVQAALAELRKLKTLYPESIPVQQAYTDAESFLTELKQKKKPRYSLPEVKHSFELPAQMDWKSPGNIMMQILQNNTWKSDFPENMAATLIRYISDDAADSISVANRITASFLTGQMKPDNHLILFFGKDFPGWCPEDERGKDFYIVSYLLDIQNDLREQGYSFTPPERAVSLLERTIRARSFLVKDGKTVWNDADALAAFACARAGSIKSLAPAQRIWPDRKTLSLYSLGMLARSFPANMPESRELQQLVHDLLKDGLSARDYSAALLFFTERDKKDPIAAKLMKTIEVIPEQDLLTVRAYRKAWKNGIRPGKDSFSVIRKEEPVILWECRENTLILNSKEEQKYVRIFVHGNTTPPPILQTKAGMLVHAHTCRGGTNYYFCHLPAGKTELQLESISPDGAVIVPVQIPQ